GRSRISVGRSWPADKTASLAAALTVGWAACTCKATRTCGGGTTSARESQGDEARSTVAEHGREHDNHQCRPYGVHGQIGDLPSLQGGKRAPVTQEARIEPRRPRQIDEQNEILAKSRHSVGSEAKLGDAGRDRRERHPVDDERA